MIPLLSPSQIGLKKGQISLKLNSDEYIYLQFLYGGF
jgi:hypothetical protein